MNGDQECLALALRRRRADLGLTQCEAAQRCSVSVSTYAAIERAEREVRESTLRSLGGGLDFDAAAAYWNSTGIPSEAIEIEGTIHRIDRTETEDGYFRTVFEVQNDEGTWTITQERTNPPGMLRAGESFVYRAEWSKRR